MSNTTAAAVCETEINFLARAIAAQHGPMAARAAADHLDQLVKRGSTRCDTWTAVVDALRSAETRRAG